MLPAPLILFIEDEADLREDIAEELEDSGFLVAQAESGRHALALLEQVRPDLILCDITMPGPDGYALLREIRENRQDLADTPFVFLTAQAECAQIIEGKRAGADDYLVKPVNFDLLLATLQTRISQIGRIRASYESNPAEGVSSRQGQRGQPADAHFQRAFDYVGFGILLLSHELELRFANRAARAMTDVIEGLRLDDAFRLADSRTMARFRAMAAAVLGDTSGGDERFDCLSLPRIDGGHNVLCMLFALGRSSADGNGADPAIMVIMSDPGQRRFIAPAALESLFGLTPTEAQVANAFADGKRSSEIAEQFGISPTTVAFHKRNLFEKTQTHRQADLVALLLSLPVCSPGLESALGG